MILRAALFFTPGSFASGEIVDMSWRVAVKTPIIAADIAIACLIFWAVPGPRWKKLLFSVLWLFNPTVWYNSAIFGQFDPIAAALLLGSIILLFRGRDRLAFLLGGLAIMTKQHVFIPFIMMVAAVARDLGWRRLLTDFGILAGVVIVISLPFVVTGNFIPYAKMVLFPGQAPGYQEPIMYAFNGAASLLTYLHEYLGWITVDYFKYFIPVLLVAILIALVLSYRRRVTPAQAALVGFLVFISFNYRINYQYLVIYIPLALWVAATTKYRFERDFSIFIALLPSAWLWLFETGFWFYFMRPENRQAIIVLERLGINRIGTPDYAFLVLALVLTVFYLVHIILTFTIWRRRETSFDEVPSFNETANKEIAKV